MEEDSIAFGRGRDVEGGVALRDVLEAHYEPLVGQLYGLTGDRREAARLVQEACVRAASAERGFRRAADREAWLRAAAVDARRTHARRSLPRCRRTRGQGTPPENAAPDFDALVCRGVRRRTRRRTGVVAAAYGMALVAGAVALVDAVPSPRPPVSTNVPMRPGLPEVEEVGDRIPAGRAAMPAAEPGAPPAVTVAVPGDGVWRENASGSGIYTALRRGAAWLHLATYVVDGVAREPCRTSHVPVAPGIPAAFVRPGPTPVALADAFADLPRADVPVRPHTVTRWGTSAVHVRVRLRHAGCRNGNLPWTFDTRRGGELLGNTHARLDFWVVELEGRPLVVEAEQPIGASAVERRPLARLLDSVELLDRESG